MTWADWHRWLHFGLARSRSQPLFRSIWLGVAIGAAAGLAAILFSEAIALTTDVLLGGVTGFYPPEALGEGSRALAEGPERPWLLPALMAIGGLVSGIIVAFFGPEAEGGGADAAIRAFHREGGRVRARVAPVKLAATAILIGSGGAVGREGPTAQIGSAIGSSIAQRLGMAAADRRKALVAGMGAGIGAIFRAPLGGAMMGAEMLYRHDFESDAVLISLVASIVAYAIFGAYTDYDPIFGGAADFQFTSAEQLPYYGLVGLLCGLAGLLYCGSLDRSRNAFRRIPGPVWVRPAIGGLAAGSIGMMFPEAIHVGYGYIQQSFTVEGVASFSPWLLLALPFLRVATSSLTVGAGGAGGIFGPGMVIGGAVGAAFWHFGNGLPGFPDTPGPMVIIAMTAMIGAVCHTPLAMLLMVAEMTGNLSLLAPAMVAVALASLIVGNTSIYENQVDSRADSPAHRDRFAFPLLTAMPSHRAVSSVSLLDSRLTPSQAAERVRGAGLTFGIVVDSRGRPLGEVGLEALDAASRDGGAPSLESLCQPLPATVEADLPLDHALDLLAAHERRWLPVVDGHDGPVLGTIDAATLLRAYRHAVNSQLRPLQPFGEDLESIEITLPGNSRMANKTLAESGLPAGVRVVTLRRGGLLSVPAGDTVILPGDVLTISCPRTRRRELLATLLG